MPYDIIDWRERKTSTFAEMLKDLTDCQWYDDAIDDPELKKWKMKMKRLLSKNLAAKKFVEWKQFLKDCPCDWRSDILHWVASQDIFKNGEFIRQIEAIKKPTEEMNYFLMEELFTFGLPHIASLPTETFDWWWRRVPEDTKGNVINALNGYCKYSNLKFDFSKIPLAHLDRIILSCFTKSNGRMLTSPSSLDTFVLLRIFELLIETSLPYETALTYHEALSNPFVQQDMTSNQRSKFNTLKLEFAKKYRPQA